MCVDAGRAGDGDQGGGDGGDGDELELHGFLLVVQRADLSTWFAVPARSVRDARHAPVAFGGELTRTRITRRRSARRRARAGPRDRRRRTRRVSGRRPGSCRRCRRRGGRRARSPSRRGSLVRSRSSAERQVVALRQQVVDPRPRRVHLEPVAGARRDERPSAAAILHGQVPARRALEHRDVLVLVGHHDADVVEARHAPQPGLQHDVERAALHLGQAELEAVLLEPLPRHARLGGDGALADPAVARHEPEAELAEVAGLDGADLARDEVVVEQEHGLIVPTASRGASRHWNACPSPPT